MIDREEQDRILFWLSILLWSLFILGVVTFIREVFF